jgi:hypothetical protein
MRSRTVVNVSASLLLLLGTAMAARAQNQTPANVPPPQRGEQKHSASAISPNRTTSQAIPMAVGASRAQNQTPANVQPPAWRTVAWKDPSTGLMWALRDSGSDVTQPQAFNYCRNLGLAGFTDWHLPEIEELQQVYDPSVVSGSWTNGAGDSFDLHVKGGIQMTAPWVWSATRGNSSGSAWFFHFQDGKRYSGVSANGGFGALCVRRAGE